MVSQFRERACLCMDNGEASTSLAVAKTRGLVGGEECIIYFEDKRRKVSVSAGTTL